MARYYGIDEANTRLAELRPLLERLRDDRSAVAEAQRELQAEQATNGSDEHATAIAEREAEVREIVRRMQRDVATIDGWGVTLRDIGAGLIDFPALANGRPIWLCWRLDEADEVGFWHEHDTGFDARRPLTELT